MLKLSLYKPDQQGVRLEKRVLRLIRPLMLAFVNLGCCALPLSLSALFVGCVSTRVEYFTDQTYTPRDSVAPIEWLAAEPTQSHIELALITVESANVSRDAPCQKILDRARALGADAIVEKGTVVVASQTRSPF